MKAAFKLQSSCVFEKCSKRKDVLDCFQLGLEKVKLFESVNRPNTTHKLVVM